MLGRPMLAGSMITILLLLQGDRNHLYKDRLPEMPPFGPRMAGSKSLPRSYISLWTFHLPENVSLGIIRRCGQGSLLNTGKLCGFHANPTDTFTMRLKLVTVQQVTVTEGQGQLSAKGFYAGNLPQRSERALRRSMHLCCSPFLSVGTEQKSIP